MVDIKLPELGEGISSVEISDVLVNTGYTLKIDDPMIVDETEKASMEIPATSSGIVNKLHVNKGGTISPGDIIITISSDTVKTPKSKNITEDNNVTIVIQDSATIDTSPIYKNKPLIIREKSNCFHVLIVLPNNHLHPRSVLVLIPFVRCFVF